MNYIKDIKILIYFLAIGLLFWVPAAFSQTTQEEPSLKEKKTKEGFIIDLKSLVNRSKQKIEEVNEKIEDQEREKRNQEREDKAREYYEKGKQLYEQGKLDKAAEYWEKAIKITEHPEMKGYVRKSAAKTKKEQKALTEAEERRLKRLEEERGFTIKEVEKTYAKAVSLFKKEKFLEAKGFFERVDEMFPDHKATRSYLMLIGQRIQEDQQELISEKLGEESEEYQKQKADWKEQLEKKAGLRRKTLEEQAEKIYQQALDLYKTKQYVSAKEKFKEVEWILPDYKATVKYLKKLDEDIKVDEILTAEDKQKLFEKQLREERLSGKATEGFDGLQQADKEREVKKRLEEEADFVYKSAVSLYKKKQYEQSKEMFLEADRIYPGYKKTRDYLVKIEKQIPQYQRELVKVKKEEVVEQKSYEDEKVKQAVIERREKFESEADKKYKEAASFYNNRNFVEAKIKFIQVEALYPDYKDTRQYLATIDDDISRQLEKGDEKAIRGLQVAWQDKIPAQKAEISRPAPREIQAREELRSLPPSQKQFAAQFKDDAEIKYKEALELYKQKQYVAAREKFVEVNEFVPGYKATKKYITRLNKKVPSIYYGKEKGEEVVQEPVMQVSAALEAEAETLYQQGLSYYKQKNFRRARGSFKKVLDVIPGYKMTKDYITRIDRRLGPEAALMEEDLSQAVETPTVPAVREQQAERLREARVEAKSEQGEVRAASEQRKEDHQTEKDFERQEKMVERLREEERKLDIGLYDRQIDGLYKEALAFYKDGNLELAKRKFYAVNTLHPDYKSTRTYLKRIEHTKIAKEEKEKLQAQIENTRKAAEEARLKAEQLKKEQRMMIEEARRKKEEGKINNQEEKKALTKREEALKEKEEAVKKKEEEANKLVQEKDQQIDQRLDQIEQQLGRIEGKLVPTDEQPAQAPEDVAGAQTESIDEDHLIGALAEEWKKAEEEALRLEKELKEAEAILRWRTVQEERVAQLMASEGEIERLEEKKYEQFREKLDRKHEGEEKAVEESKNRIDKRIEALKKEYVENEKFREDVSQQAILELEKEQEQLRANRDRLLNTMWEKTSTESEMDLSIPPTLEGGSFTEGLDQNLMRELETLEAKIQVEEKKLVQDRMLAEEQLQQQRKQLAKQTHKMPDFPEELKVTRKKEEPIAFEKRYRQLLEEDNEAELGRLVRSRQKELRNERERLQHEFQQSIDDLYNKAVDLHQAGMVEEAQRMFNEVNIMAPGYKKTQSYLAKIDEAANDKWNPKKTKNQYGQEMITPSARQLQTREQVISSSLDSFGR
ncbi:MAG TPA: tetratricopeptide repeat protein [Candidatus Omnitrophota bacterium]|nr:tetratricopeptide repeat protein [Candidatus Omnitrophota bacterium]